MPGMNGWPAFMDGQDALVPRMHRWQGWQGCMDGSNVWMARMQGWLGCMDCNGYMVGNDAVMAWVCGWKASIYLLLYYYMVML